MKKRRMAVPLVDTATLTREEWKEYRKHGVGASDVPAIMGLSSFKTVIKLFEEKISRIPKEEIEKQREERLMKEAENSEEDSIVAFGELGKPIIDPNASFTLTTQVGHALEPVTAKYLSCKLGMPVFKDTIMYQHPDYPFLCVNLDYLMLLPDDNGELNRLIIIECKTATFWKKEEWELGVPPDYEMQCRAAMAVMDVDEVIIICLLDNNEGGVFTYRISRDISIEHTLIMAVKTFWNHVLTETLPLPPLPSKRAASEMAAYAKAYPKQKTTPELFEEGLTELVDDYCSAYRAAKQKEKEFEVLNENVDVLKLRLSAYMIDKDKAKVGPLSLSWVYKKTPSVDFEALRLAYPHIYAKYVTERDSMYFNAYMNQKKLEAMEHAENSKEMQEAA